MEDTCDCTVKFKYIVVNFFALAMYKREASTLFVFFNNLFVGSRNLFTYPMDKKFLLKHYFCVVEVIYKMVSLISGKAAVSVVTK